MIPPFDDRGKLPPGIHWADWDEFELRFGASRYRGVMLSGLKKALVALQRAKCSAVYVDGSFVTAKEEPGDYDGCWSVHGVDPAALDPVLLDFAHGRRAQKARYLGELFPAEIPEGATGKLWIEFFQQDKETGEPKGIVGIDLSRPL